MNIATAVEWSDLLLAIAAPSVTRVMFTTDLTPQRELRPEYAAIQSATPESYRNAFSDLSDLRDEASYDDWETPVSLEALRTGASLIAQLQQFAQAPEVSALENGVLALTWVFASGYVVIEMGSSSYGLLVMRNGEPIVMRNGKTWELQRLVDTEITPLFNPSAVQRAPVAQSDLGAMPSAKNTGPSAFSWWPSFGGAAAAPA